MLASTQKDQYVEVVPLKPAPFCTLFIGHGSINKSATSFLLLSDSRSVLTSLSSPPPFLLPKTLWQIWQELSFSLLLFYYATMGPRTLVSTGKRRG